MTNVTAGPWKLGEGGFMHANRVWTQDMRPVANLCSFGSSPADLDPVAQANGRLIAAAPSLLAACKRAKKLLEPEVTKEPDRTIFWELVAAIRRAEGSPPEPEHRS